MNFTCHIGSHWPSKIPRKHYFIPFFIRNTIFFGRGSIKKGMCQSLNVFFFRSWMCQWLPCTMRVKSYINISNWRYEGMSVFHFREHFDSPYSQKIVLYLSMPGIYCFSNMIRTSFISKWPLSKFHSGQSLVRTYIRGF